MKTTMAPARFTHTLLSLLLLSATVLNAAEPARPFGLDRRVPWTTSTITGSPDPPPPFAIEPVLPGLRFTDPVILTRAPGTPRLFLVELAGKVLSFNPRTKPRAADLAVDLAPAIEGLRQVYGLAFHPNFATNRYCYITYVLKNGDPLGTVVSRFTVSKTDPPTIDPKSQKTVIRWLAGGHNGGCLEFGPDGFLYISAGDGAGAFPPDSRRNGQNLATLPATIMRIDVDRPSGDRLYSIPADNPFVDTPAARPEVWAYGFRNPWKITFDPTNGALWCGDVGWEMWEMIYRVEKGANYGWSIVEASQSVHPEWDRGPTSISPPAVAHSHTESRSISGGEVYTGKRLKSLTGAYIYGDYVTGKIWSARHDGKRLLESKELVDTTLQIVCFGTDHEGELYVVDYAGGGLHRLVPGDPQAVNRNFPRKLSDTGLFASTRHQRLAPGVIPYSVGAAPWADHAVAHRFLALPGTSKLGIHKSSNIQIGNVAGGFAFPIDGVLAKTISLDLVAGDPRSRRPIETQLLHFNGQSWQAYNYIWNDTGSDAVLAEDTGSDSLFTVTDPSAPGGKRVQAWHHASRTECILCHTTRGGSLYGFTPAQLNRDHRYGTVTDNQFRTLSHIGLLTGLPEKLPTAMPDPADSKLPLAQRARAYLHANCATCHRRGGGGTAAMDIRYEFSLKQSNLLGARPTQGTFGMLAARVMAPAGPYRSVLLYRMAKLGRGRMPHFGSQVVDRHGLQLVHDWIASLDPKLAAQGTRDASAATLRKQHDALLATLALPDLDAAAQAAAIDQLLLSSSGALQLALAVDHPATPLPKAAARVAVKAGAGHADVRVRDLFERFLPYEKRVKRLGSTVQAQQILKIPGNAGVGRQLFTKAAGFQCRNCHRVAKQGKSVGPDLDGIAKKNDRRALLESILQPSQKIDPKFRAYLVETAQGRVHTGLLISKSDKEVVLRDAAGKEIRVAGDDVEMLIAQPKSLMPELLVKDMTAQQLADLLAFLESLK
jgi:putative heme-binding domain-containing protein